MKIITIKKIGFGSYVKLLAISGLSLGLSAGLFSLIMGFFGRPVSLNLFGAQYTGITAAYLGVLAYPVMMGVVFTLFALLAYLPFKGLLALSKGLKLRLEVLDEAVEAVEEEEMPEE